MSELRELITKIQEADIFKPASKTELIKRRKESPFMLANWADKYGSAVDIYGSAKLCNKIEELTKQNAKFMILSFDLDEQEDSEVKQEIRDCISDGYTFLNYEENGSSGEAILYKLQTTVLEAEIFKPASKSEIKKRRATGIGKERVYINVYTTEDGDDLYRVEGYDRNGKATYQPPDICDSGYFIDNDSLNDWLEDNKDEIIVVEDYRSN